MVRRERGGGGMQWTSMVLPSFTLCPREYKKSIGGKRERGRERETAGESKRVRNRRACVCER